LCTQDIDELSESLVGETVWVRARVANSRAVGKGVFLVLRQTVHTIQCVMFQSDTVPKQMVKYAAGVSLESVVDVLVTVTRAATPVTCATVKVSSFLFVSSHFSVPERLERFIRDAAWSSSRGRVGTEGTVASFLALLKTSSLLIRIS